jgi:hypothetical protein
MMLPQLPHPLLADACTGQALLPDLYDGLRGRNGAPVCEVTITQLNDILKLVGNGISILMFVAGFVAIGFIIVGGFTYITSSGDPAGIKKAKETIINAIVGLVIAMISFGVVTFITGSF